MGIRALDLVFPRRCAGCGHGSWPFCPDCARRLDAIAPPWCTRCGAPSPVDVPRCDECPPPPLTSARAAFRYEGPSRRAVHRLKFSGWRDVAAALGAAMAAVPDLATPDVLTWVPLARRRRAERGYDQARALTTAVGRELGIRPVRALRRPRAGGPQAQRGGRDRREAMRGAYVAVRLVHGHVLLVDDVLTTGATAAACAETLLGAGATSVGVLAAARSLRPAALRGDRGGAYPQVGPRPGLWLPGDLPR
jgi:ComF family protein